MKKVTYSRIVQPISFFANEVFNGRQDLQYRRRFFNFQINPSCPVRDVTPPKMKIERDQRATSNSIFELIHMSRGTPGSMKMLHQIVIQAKAGIQIKENT
jgi:hypothetical protein